MERREQQPDVSILVVSYNTAEYTLAAIESVYRQAVGSFEIIVVDNDSRDGSADRIAERFPDVRLVRSDENLGFAGGNNLAARLARGRYLLLLNPDTVVLDHAIDRLVGFADGHPEYGIYGGGTRFPDMSRNPTAGWNMTTGWSLFCTAVGLSSVFRGSRLFDSESLASRRWEGAMPVDIVTGCFLLISRDLWRRLDGFDTRFHMYAEDADLCLRTAAAGRPCVLVPEAEIIHYGGASEPARADRMVRLLRAKVQLFRKHWSAPAAAYAVVMLATWAWSRRLALAAGSRFRKTAREGAEQWNAVWLRRGEWVRV